MKRKTCCLLLAATICLCACTTPPTQKNSIPCDVFFGDVPSDAIMVYDLPIYEDASFIAISVPAYATNESKTAEEMTISDACGFLQEFHVLPVYKDGELILPIDGMQLSESGIEEKTSRTFVTITPSVDPKHMAMLRSVYAQGETLIFKMQIVKREIATGKGDENASAIIAFCNNIGDIAIHAVQFVLSE